MKTILALLIFLTSGAFAGDATAKNKPLYTFIESSFLDRPFLQYGIRSDKTFYARLECKSCAPVLDSSGIHANGAIINALPALYLAWRAAVEFAKAEIQIANSKSGA